MSIGAKKQRRGEAAEAFTALVGAWRVPGTPYWARTAREPGTNRGWKLAPGTRLAPGEGGKIQVPGTGRVPDGHLRPACALSVHLQL